MSETQQRPSVTGDGPPPAPRRRKATAWVGVVVFGGIMMTLVGAFEATQGLVALFNDDYYVVTSGGLLVTFDYTTWGWVHLLLGALAVGAGVGVFLGQLWARIVGIVIAAVSALANLAFLPSYPVWCTIVIAMDVLVIYALAAHGREVA